MAKKASGNTFPKDVVAAKMKDYSLVTDDNKKAAMVYGRRCYVIEPYNAVKWICRCVLTLRPRHRGKRTMEVANDPGCPNPYSFYIYDEESVQDYRDMLKIFEMYLGKGQLYVKLTDKLVTYKYI